MSGKLREQVAAYLLGELESAELAEFERRLADEPGLRDEVDRMGRVVQELRELPRESWETEELPPLELPVAELSGPPARTAAARWRRWLTPGRIAIAGAVSFAVFAGGIVVGAQLGDDPEPEPAIVTLSLRPLTGQQGQATGSVELTGADGRTAEVVVDGLPPNEPETYYELWLLRGDETVSLGSFTVGPDGHADTAISIPVDPGGYEAFDVSLESEDGDPSHSGDSLLRGPTAPF